MTPVWYASVRDCPVHREWYDVRQTPQWWTDGEARGWRTQPSKTPFVSERARPGPGLACLIIVLLYGLGLGFGLGWWLG